MTIVYSRAGTKPAHSLSGVQVYVWGQHGDKIMHRAGEPRVRGEGKSWGKEHFSGDSLNPFALCMHRHAHSSPGYLTKLISN